MTAFFDDFEIFNKISHNIKIEIKSFYVFKDCFSVQNLLYVTKDDKVFGFGHNYCGTLGLGHNQKVKKSTKIKHLSNQRINNFFSGWTHVLGRTEDNELFSWGWNIWGQLGRGYKTLVNECLKPEKIEFFKNEMIDELCCGYYHTLVLTTNGFLYGWGRNSEGQLGLTNERSVDKPTKLEINERSDLRFKYIHCCHFSSFAISSNGLLFSWGYNQNGILGQEGVGEKCIPRVINLFNVQKISSTEFNTYFLTNEGFVYFCGKYEYKSRTLIRSTPIQMNDQKIIIHDLLPVCGTAKETYCVYSEDIFYRLCLDQCEIVTDNYRNKSELYAKLLGITPQMFHISSDGKIAKTDLREFMSTQMTKLLKINFAVKGLQEMAVIGSGGFGTVRKCLDFSEKTLFAIKVIDIKNSENDLNENVMNEVLTMSKLKSHFVVQYNDSWIENNCLHIQMEYCFDNLRNVMTIKSMVFERNTNQAMNSIEYFISCQIFRQITEALNYLHSLRPEPLIHRDLKPENILIGYHNNRSICKLADFGLSKFIVSDSDYHTMIGATHKYRAPEIGSGHRYNTKVDIWSLGIIAVELFNLDNEVFPNASKTFAISHLFNKTVNQKLERCDHFISHKLLTAKRHQRISCEEILTQMGVWSLDKHSIRSSIQLKTYRDQFEKFNLIYFYHALLE